MEVSIFVTCLVDNLFPNVATSMVRVLNTQGVHVHYPPGQTCCGQPAFNSGYHAEAKTVATQMLDAFEDAKYVVSPSGSCTGMMHHYYGQLFADDEKLAKRAKQLAAKTYEFSQFMVDILGVQDVQATFERTVTYHPSCHGMRLLGVKDEPLQLLSRVRGIQFVDLPHQNDCCGFGGTFAVKMHEISKAMVDEKVDWVVETGAEVLVGTDMGCLMNIGGRLRHRGEAVRVMHLAELLSEGMVHTEVNRL